MLTAIIYLPSSEHWYNQNAFAIVFSAIPRIIVASLISYTIGEFTNSYILAKMKIKASSNDTLLKRIAISCFIGIIFDTSLFIIIAYLWVLQTNDLFFLIIRQFTLKICIEFIMLPITLFIIRYIKLKENLDIVDIDTDFTPFSLDVSYNSHNNMANNVAKKE